MSANWNDQVMIKFQAYRKPTSLYFHHKYLRCKSFRCCKQTHWNPGHYFCFFQLCLYLTVWLAEDYHFDPNAPNVICGFPMTKIYILGGVVVSTIPILGVKNAQIWGGFHEQNLYIWSVQNTHFESKNAKICHKMVLLQMPPKSHLGQWSSMAKTLHIWSVQNAHFGSQKCQNLPKNVFAPNAPKSHLGVSNDQHLHIWGTKPPAPCYQYSSL